MKGKMRVLNARGDTAIEWDTEDEASVKEAEKQYEALQRRRMVGFAIQTAKGTKREGRQLDQFEPQEEEILMVPQIAGGSF